MSEIKSYPALSINKQNTSTPKEMIPPANAFPLNDHTGLIFRTKQGSRREYLSGGARNLIKFLICPTMLG